MNYTESPEVFQENIRMDANANGGVKTTTDTDSLVTMDDIKERHSRGWVGWRSEMRKLRSRRALRWVIAATVAILTIIVACAITYKLTEAAHQQNKGVNNVQGCLAHTKKQTFPDIGYALFGYNVIRGNPMTAGQDPGLTRPIFNSDYTRKQHTADCQYAVPKGLVVVQDVSCSLSFDADVIHTPFQLSKSLETYAENSGREWGAKFSANKEYKHKYVELESKRKVYVNSKAKCDYYSSKIDEIRPPLLDNSFVNMARSLKTKQDVFKFFEYYGTHYLKEVTFGARLTHESKVAKKQFNSMKGKYENVAVVDTYASIARVIGKTGLTKGEQKQAALFRKNSVTSTISIGAPPPLNGNAQDWALAVKKSPAPTKYRLAGIEELFTAHFMAGKVGNYAGLEKLVKKSKRAYCMRLKKQGIVDSCKPLDSYTKFRGIAIDKTWYALVDTDLRHCIKACNDDEKCVAANHWKERTHRWRGKTRRWADKCVLYSSSRRWSHEARAAKGHTLILFIERLNARDDRFKITHVQVAAQARAEMQTAYPHQCQQQCQKDTKCIAYTSDFHGMRNCNLYDRFAFTENSMRFKSGSIIGGSFVTFQFNKTVV